MQRQKNRRAQIWLKPHESSIFPVTKALGPDKIVWDTDDSVGVTKPMAIYICLKGLNFVFLPYTKFEHSENLNPSTRRQITFSIKDTSVLLSTSHPIRYIYCAKLFNLNF